MLQTVHPRKSNGGNQITTIRRSPRFQPREEAYGKEPQVWKNLECSPRIVAESKTHSRSTLSSVKSTLPMTTLRRSPRFRSPENPSGNAVTGNPKSTKNRVCSLSNTSPVKIHYKSILSPKTTGSCGLPEISAESLNVSRKSTCPLDVGESLPSLRRSSRFFNKENASAFVANKAGNNRAELLVCRYENDSSNKGVSAEVPQKRNLGKNRSRNVEVQRVFTNTAGKAGEGVNSTVSTAATPRGVKKISDLANEGIRVHPKRKQHDEGCSPQGWTKEQETALRRAFITGKPSPHFWKKVSKLVPGKSAQECFDKVHSDLSTPPHPRPLSRANRTNLSSLDQISVSGSELLETTKMSVKRQKISKPKSRLTQKTVRHLLRKHYLADQSSEVSLFSLQKGLASPLVLKQVKNISLHEKYIDQLHCREARRTSASSYAAKHIVAEYDDKESHIQTSDVVKIARNALVSGAQEMINEFKHLQANSLANNDDCDDDYDEDEGEGDELP
ncbi:uncharacterized protein LOC122657584 isoform X2 [Telopea speciosissima]|uniref:uncharacterized protein LOC122657584 isoform X2 n=1 Tax=Telopea speciosissima TaxID=54955 RepID=UPI001CC6D023|nr:uncharacterized protein LOC122657584 isoform X2 [Telopea speciosissima]